MMRKQFPVTLHPPLLADSASARTRQWSPPPAPLQYQNSKELSSCPSSPLGDQRMEACFGVRRSSENQNNSSNASPSNSVASPTPIYNKCPTRLSFGSIFSQLRRLPNQRHSLKSTCGLSSTTSQSSPSTPPAATPPETARRDSLLHDLPIPPSTLTNHQASKNLKLLKMFTDSGPYSRVQAMTIASVLYNRKVTEADIRGDLTPKQKFAYKKFCLEIEDKLEMITSRSPAKSQEPFTERTLRKIWHLYALYTKALSDQIWDEGTAKADITSRAIAHLVKRAIAGGPEDQATSTSEDPPEAVNPVLASLLKDPIPAFLVVYGRYCSTGKVLQCERLRKLTHFNDIVEEFFQKLVHPPENEDIDTYLLLLRQQQQCQQKWSSSGTFTGYGTRSNCHTGSSKRSLQTGARARSLISRGVSGGGGAAGSGTGFREETSAIGGDKRFDSYKELSQDKVEVQPPSYPVVVLETLVHQQQLQPQPPQPVDNDVRSLQRKIQMLDGKKRICLVGCRYDVLTTVALSAGFEIVGENDLWNINWSDTPLAQEKISQMRRVQDMYSVFWGLNAPLQRCNHFPGMYEICRKDRLGRNLNRLKRLFPHDYNFFPETFDLPTEQSDLIAYHRRRKRNNVTFIIKPESGCQGKGIFLLRNLKKLSPFAKCVCQVYVPHPFLIDGYKFDQRIYVLITCVDPLRLYIYEEGIARFATVKYEVPTEENLEVVYMHLTNYSLNKFSESYVREGDGSKRTLSSIYQWMISNGYDVDKLRQDIDDIVVKTLLCAAPTLKHNYKTSFPKRDRGCSCFELLGFDILLDRHLNPVLLEVNHSPSFNLDLPVDHSVKKALLKDMLNMVYLGEELRCPQGPPQMQPVTRRKKKKGRKKEVEEEGTKEGEISEALQRQFRWEMRNKGNFRLIYSSEKPGRFHKLVCGEEGYCGYNVGVQMVAGGGMQQQVVFDDKDGPDWEQEPETSSTVKVTKSGKKYVETRVVHPPDWEKEEGRRFREVQQKKPGGDGKGAASSRSKSRTSNGHSEAGKLKRRKAGKSGKRKEQGVEGDRANNNNWREDEGASGAYFGVNKEGYQYR